MLLRLREWFLRFFSPKTRPAAISFFGGIITALIIVVVPLCNHFDQRSKEPAAIAPNLIQENTTAIFNAAAASDSLIDALSWIDVAISNLEEVGKKVDETGFELIEVVYGYKTSINALKRAEDMIRYWPGAPKLIAELCKVQEKRLEKCIAYYEELYLLSPNINDQESLKEAEKRLVGIQMEAAGLAVELHEGWTGITTLTVLFTHQIIEFPDKDKPGRLKMADSERKRLLRKIDESFPSANDNLDGMEGQTATLVAVSALKKVLAEFPTRS